MNSKKKTINCIFAAIIIVFGVISALFVGKFIGNLNIDEDEYVFIDTDDNIDSVRQKLTATNAGVSMMAFDMLNSYTHYEDHIRPGRYRVSNTLSTLDLFRNMRNHQSEPVNLIVPSVRTIDDMAGKLARNLMIDSATIADRLHDKTLCDSLGYTLQTIPALFIPNTYQVYWETSVDGLVSRLVQVNGEFWTDERVEKASKTGLTKVEVITLASIVDSETANDGEKPRIAGLYMNRLHKDMLLQSDPTVIYAVGDFTIRRVLNRHLAVESPYNTYRVHGLPPGPIRIPSIAGIDAVLNYEHHNYIYMCAKEDFSGTHNFAETYAQHAANARRYIEALNRKGIK